MALVLRLDIDAHARVGLENVVLPVQIGADRAHKHVLDHLEVGKHGTVRRLALLKVVDRRPLVRPALGVGSGADPKLVDSLGLGVVAVGRNSLILDGGPPKVAVELNLGARAESQREDTGETRPGKLPRERPRG